MPPNERMGISLTPSVTCPSNPRDTSSSSRTASQASSWLHVPARAHLCLCPPPELGFYITSSPVDLLGAHPTHTESPWLCSPSTPVTGICQITGTEGHTQDAAPSSQRTSERAGGTVTSTEHLLCATQYWHLDKYHFKPLSVK